MKGEEGKHYRKQNYKTVTQTEAAQEDVEIQLWSKPIESNSAVNNNFFP